MPLRLKTEKKIHIAAILLAFCVSVAASGQGRVVYVTEAEIAAKAVTEQKLQSQLEFLTDSLCEGRATGSAGANAVTFWLAGRFRSLGFRPMAGDSYIRHFETGDGRTGRNVIGVLRGSDQPSQAGYVIVAASYDGLGILEGNLYPGADSNASGIAALFGVADMVKSLQRTGKRYARNLIFVALDGKNLSLSGSQALWEDIEAGRLTDPVTGRVLTKDRIALFVNLDQLGSTLSPLHEDRPDYLLMINGRTGAAAFDATLDNCNTRNGIGLDLGYDYYGSKDFTRLFYSRVSDQRVFVENDVPAVMFTSGITMNNNKVHDTVQTLDLGVLKRRIQLIFHWVERHL